MKSSGCFRYTGAVILSVVFASICVYQIIEAEKLYAILAAIFFVITFFAAIEELIRYYYKHLVNAYIELTIKQTAKEKPESLRDLILKINKN